MRQKQYWKQSWEQELREGFAAAGQEFRQLIGHVNDRIVPEIRTEARSALQEMAVGLRRTADWLDQNLGTRRA